MVAPRLAPLRHVLPGSAEGEAFVVVADGDFGGRRWRAGEVMVCGDGASDAPVVLVARGHGRPRLGSVTGGEVRGDVGEPCSPERWRVAGRVVEVRWGGEAVADACRRLGSRLRSEVPFPGASARSSVAHELGGGGSIGRGAGAPWPSRRGGRDGHTPAPAGGRTLGPPPVAGRAQGPAAAAGRGQPQLALFERRAA